MGASQISHLVGHSVSKSKRGQGFTSYSQHSSRCDTTLLHSPWGCSSAGWGVAPGRSTHTAAWRRILRLTSSDTPLTSAGCLRHTLQSTGSHIVQQHRPYGFNCKNRDRATNPDNVTSHIFSYSRQHPLKPSMIFCHPHTWLQGPVYHSMRFSQGPLLQTWESVGRSLPQPSRGRLLMWLVRQRTPRVRTPTPHSAEHCGVNTRLILTTTSFM